MTKPKESPSTKFLAAAARVLSDNARATKDEYNKRRRDAAEERGQERQHKKVIYDTFADYRRLVAPVVEALEKLPARKGEEFIVRLDQFESTDRYARRLNLWIAYSTPVDHGKDKNVEVNQLPMPRKGGGQGDIWPKDNGRLILNIKLESPPGRGERIVTMNDWRKEFKSMEELPAYIGEWVANEVPERLAELKKAMSANSEPRANSRAPGGGRHSCLK